MESPNKITLGQMTGLNFDILNGREPKVALSQQAHLRSSKHRLIQIIHSFLTIISCFYSALFSYLIMPLCLFSNFLFYSLCFIAIINFNKLSNTLSRDFLMFYFHRFATFIPSIYISLNGILLLQPLIFPEACLSIMSMIQTIRSEW